MVAEWGREITPSQARNCQDMYNVLAQPYRDVGVVGDNRAVGRHLLQQVPPVHDLHHVAAQVELESNV